MGHCSPQHSPLPEVPPPGQQLPGTQKPLTRRRASRHSAHRTQSLHDVNLFSVSGLLTGRPYYGIMCARRKGASASSQPGKRCPGMASASLTAPPSTTPGICHRKSLWGQPRPPFPQDQLTAAANSPLTSALGACRPQPPADACLHTTDSGVPPCSPLL